MRKCHWQCLLILVIALTGGVLLWRTFIVHWLEPHPGRVSSDVKSSDVAADIRLMWETRMSRGTPDPNYGPNPRCSTDRAINAASRVFNTVELVGRNREDVVALLGDPQVSSDSIYSFPFWPVPNWSLVYRFDSGAYGWQFNLVFGVHGRVVEVERHWIH